LARFTAAAHPNRQDRKPKHPGGSFTEPTRERVRPGAPNLGSRRCRVSPWLPLRDCFLRTRMPAEQIANFLTFQARCFRNFAHHAFEICPHAPCPHLRVCSCISAAFRTSITHTEHCTLHSARCTLHTARYTLHAAHCMYTLQAAHCTLRTVRYTLHTAHGPLHTARCTRHATPCTFRTARCTLHCPLHAAH